METAGMFLGSRLILTGDLGQNYSPFDLRPVASFVASTIQDAKEALCIAHDAFDNTRRIPLSSRLAWLNDVAEKLVLYKEDFAQTITAEVGKPIQFSRIEVERARETLLLTCAALTSLHGETIPTDVMSSGKQTLSFFRRIPSGVVVAITPFNFPLNLIMHKIAPALGAGNTVVLKPTPEAPLTAYKLAKLFIESPYALPHALSLVYGDADVGSTLVSSPIPRVISFTGSASVGHIITQQAGIKKVSLELGGNAATYIDKNADIAIAAKRCAFGAFINSGQVCISLQRLYVHADVYETFAQALKNESEKLIVGSPENEETFIGPLVNHDALHRAINWLDNAKNEGAVCFSGGIADKKTCTLTPTIMTNVTDNMKIVCEEVFAPIVSLIKVTSFDEALEKINTGSYGLQHSVFTYDLRIMQRALDEFRCGGVVINDIPTLRFDVQPYGGIGQSGIGREGPRFALEEFTEIQSVVIV